MVQFQGFTPKVGHFCTPIYTLLYQAHLAGVLHLEIVNLSGQRLYKEEFSPETGRVVTRELKVNSLAPGGYLLKLTGTGHQQVKRFVVVE